eukprot:Polyplicarium_translucidae@DN2583_c0_g1_i2.p1
MSIGWMSLINLTVVAAAMMAMWLLSVCLKDVSIVDIFWGLGFLLVAWCTVGVVQVWSGRPLLLALMATAWGLRLSCYLAWRNVGKEEDYRYQQMRERWGNAFPCVSLFVVFGLQGVLMWVVSFPVQAGICGSNHDVYWADAVGLAVWTVGLVVESVADMQLASFVGKPENRGRVMDTGLWRFTRHPNYFGEFLVWWGFYGVACAAGAWWTFYSPLLMSFLLLKVSGVAMLERGLKRRRPDYEAYAQRTSAFVPWWPRKVARGDSSAVETDEVVCTGTSAPCQRAATQTEWPL